MIYFVYDDKYVNSLAVTFRSTIRQTELDLRNFRMDTVLVIYS